MAWHATRRVNNWQQMQAKLTINTIAILAQNIEITAIIVGMLSFGFVADVIGRKWGSR